MLHDLRTAYQVIELVWWGLLILLENIFERGIQVFYSRLELSTVLVKVILSKLYALISGINPGDTPEPESPK